MKIAIASDHKGYRLKTTLINYLNKKGYEVFDLGTDSIFSTDYPKYAFSLCDKVSKKEVDYGIVICGTGIGISIACNKVNGIRCAKVDNIKEAKLTRHDNDANVLALSGNMFAYKAKDIVDVFLKAEFSNQERHIKRLKMIEEYERGKYNER
ncbi:MAG: ribose 5-phosphate isomerase B [Bacilli bacterium]|nr:ribose 5-phosphate isomerase B [Bacilli bacterium]